MATKLAIIIISVSYSFCMDPIIQDLLTPNPDLSEGCGYQSCPKTETGRINVHIVPHSHGELGYTKTFYEHFTGHDDYYEKSQINMKRILDYTITELWSDAERSFTFSEMPYFFHWWANRDETVRRMVYQLLRQGRLYFVGGGWSMSDESCTSYQAIIDHFTYSLRKINSTFLECARPLVAWQADSFGHSREFASLMAQMGFDALFINPISYDDEIARMKRKAMEFVWRGSDDLGSSSDIFTHKLFDGYWSPPGFCFGSMCGDPLLVSSSELLFNIQERVNLFIESVKFRQNPYYTTKHVMVMMGMRMGYHDASVWFANINRLMNSLNMKTPISNVVSYYSTPACYLKAVYESNPLLQTKQDDFIPFAYDENSYATGAYSSRPTLKYIAREGFRYLQMAKQLQVSAKLPGHYELFEELNWINGVFQDHNIITGALRPHVMKYYIKKMDITVQKTVSFIRRAFNVLRNSPKDTMYYRCYFNVSSCINTGATQMFVVIYNPLAWPVSMPVRLPTFYKQSIVFHPSGDRIKAAIMRIPQAVVQLPTRFTKAMHELVFLAEDIPPMGYRSYYIQKRHQTLQRPARSIIKKINKNNAKTKKYMVRQGEQTNSFDTQLYDNEPDYLYFDEDASTTKQPKIIFGNVSRNDNYESFDDVVTPKRGRCPWATTPHTIVNINENLNEYINETPNNQTEMNASLMNEAKNDSETFILRAKSKTHVTEANQEISDMADQYMTTPDILIKINDKPTTETALEMERATQKDRTTEKDNSTKIEASTDREVIERERATMKMTEVTRPTEKTAVANVTEVLKENATGSSTVTTESTSTKPTTPKGVNVTRTTSKPQVDNYRRSGSDDSEDFWRGYAYVMSDDMYIRNRYVRVNLDSNNRIANISLANGIRLSLKIEMFYYVSDDPDRMKKVMRSPGAYLFRAMDPKAERIQDYADTKVFKNEMVQEIHCICSDYAAFTLRLYRKSPVLEVDWVVGPIPIKDQLGKEVFIKYVTNISNDGAFYTDSNGRQTIKRIRNMRATFEPVNKDPIAGNLYPVTSKIYIEDTKENVRFSVFNDRSQAGSSLADGEINMLLHRRLLTDDGGIQAWMNDTEFEEGVIVRGQHYIYIAKADHKPHKIFEKKLAKEIELKPQIFASSMLTHGVRTKLDWFDQKNDYSALNSKLPLGVHILTLQHWNDDTLLLRLENYLEKSDVVSTGVKRVYIRNLFKNFEIIKIRETLLGGNVWLSDYSPLNWNKDKFLKNFNEAYGTGKFDFDDESKRPLEKANIDRGIILEPQQIRTFVIWVKYS